MFETPTFSVVFGQTCARGFARAAGEAQLALAHAVTEAQREDGLFPDRSGRGDWYYTFFGLVLALIAGARIRREPLADRVKEVDPASLDLVHACAFLRVRGLLDIYSEGWFSGASRLGRWLRWNMGGAPFRKSGVETFRALESLESLPRHAFPHRDPEAPYARFLTATLLEDFGRTPPLVALDAYRVQGGRYDLPDSLYGNLKHPTEYGLNATAAALYLLREPQRSQTAQALAALQEPDGSFKAARHAPEGDVLSTASACFALCRCGVAPAFSSRNFLRACFRENGLFAATPTDLQGDLEYSVYGLLVMGVGG